MATEQEFQQGDQVSWHTHGTSTQGTVQRKISEETEAAGRAVKADQEHPQYLVRSDKSGRDAVHKPAALEKKQK
ncbi:MAG: DUF2945 domain-containing protein [Nakamurella sp.]